jgi:hypothetical protein
MDQCRSENKLEIQQDERKRKEKKGNGIAGGGPGGRECGFT